MSLTRPSSRSVDLSTNQGFRLFIGTNSSFPVCGGSEKAFTVAHRDIHTRNTWDVMCMGRQISIQACRMHWQYGRIKWHTKAKCTCNNVIYSFLKCHIQASMCTKIKFWHNKCNLSFYECDWTGIHCVQFARIIKLTLNWVYLVLEFESRSVVVLCCSACLNDLGWLIKACHFPSPCFLQ